MLVQYSLARFHVMISHIGRAPAYEVMSAYPSLAESIQLQANLSQYIR